MATARLRGVQSVIVDRAVVGATLQALQKFGAHGLEGLILWLGDIEPDRAHVFRMYIPDQQPLSSEDGVGYFVRGKTLFELNQDLAESGLRLIAQVHSHPGEAYHSRADDRYAIVTAEGGFSLVVPDFGDAPADPTAWAVYRLDQGAWRELSIVEARAILKVGE